MEIPPRRTGKPEATDKPKQREGRGQRGGKSERPVVAMNSGNAQGAKGSRCEKAS